MGSPEGLEVDHFDGNRLNNQRANLRPCTHGQNQCNRGKQKNNTSGYKGVYWHKAAKKWFAQIQTEGKQHHLGLFTSKLVAARAYREAALRFHGAFAHC